MKTITLVSREV